MTAALPPAPERAPLDPLLAGELTAPSSGSPGAPGVPGAPVAPGTPADGRFRMGRIGRQTAVYGVGMVAAKALSFLLLPLYTRFLSPADYGVIQLVQMTFDVISIVAGARLAVGVFRFYHKAETREAKHAVFSTALVLLTATFFVMAAAAFAAAPLLSRLVFGDAAHARFIRIAAASFVFQAMTIVPLAFLRAREESRRFVLATLAQIGVQAGLNVLLLVVFRLGLLGMFLSSLLTNALLGLVLAGYQLRVTGARIHRGPLGDLVRFGWPLMLTQIATFVLTFGDRYFLERAAGPSAVGLYALAYSFGFLLANIGYQPFSTVWDPLRFEIAKRADRDEIFARAFVYMNVLLLTMAVGLSLFVHDFLRVMAAPAFAGAGAVVPVILAAYVLQCWSGVQDIGIMVRERTGWHTVANWIGAGVAVAGYALWIPRFEAWGAALATLAAFAARQALIYAASQRLWPVRYHWAPVARLTALAVAIAAARVALPPFALVPSLAASVGLFALYLAGVWTLGIIPAADRGAIVALARRRALGAGALRTLLTGSGSAR